MKDEVSEREINKFFTELLGGCFHKWEDPFEDGWLSQHNQCTKCKKYRDEALDDRINFFTWEGFGKLWNWAITQKDFLRWWKADLVRNSYGHTLVNPTSFARKLYLSLIKKGGNK